MLRWFGRQAMSGYNFTERARKVLAKSREEGARLHHEYIGTEHILLGLIREGEGVAATVLQNLNIDLDDVREKIERGVKKGPPSQTSGPDLPYTSRAKKVLELAMEEARDLHHAYVGTEHLLLGLVREERGIAAQVLVDAGLTLDRAREETLRILGTEVPGAFRASPTSRQTSTRAWPPPDAGEVAHDARGRPALHVRGGQTMNGYNFTQHVRATLAKAREEAARLRHEYVGTEHLLLALLHSGAGVGLTVVESFGVDPGRMAATIDEIVKSGQAPNVSPADLPYTSRAKTVLELTMDEARIANDSYVGTEHLLLGMLREEKGIAAQILADNGITLESARERVRAMPGQHHTRNEAQHGNDPTGASLRMAALMIETLVRDDGVASVFAAQGIDAARLAAALRNMAPQRPPDTPPAA